MTENYKKLYLEYCANLCDCVTKEDVKRHNNAMKRLSNLYHQIEKEKNKDFLLDLLQNENERTKALAAAHCLGLGVYVSEAKNVLSTLAKNKSNPVLAFEAQATLDVWKQNGYLQFQSNVAEIRDGYTLKFLYNNGEAAGFSYNGADYYYGKDSFGVIRYLYNTSGEVVTTYTYDAWGTVLSVTGTLAETVGTVNPVRYKSYYLDSETGWYYLQSRYYDPAVGRFLNADEVLLINQTENSIKGTNAFGYCYNDPIRMYDISGTEPGYINDQEDPSVAKIKWGLLGNTKYNGCGWVAVYNVMHSYSSKITYNYVIRHLDLCGGVLALGKLGASPSGITAFLNTRFWTVNRIGPITRW